MAGYGVIPNRSTGRRPHLLGSRNKKPRRDGRGFPFSLSRSAYSREERNISTMRNMLMNEMKKFSAPQFVITASERASPSKA